MRGYDLPTPTRRPSFRVSRHAKYLSTPTSPFNRSISQQDIERRSFEASNIAIMVTSPCAETPGRGGSTHTVFPSPGLGAVTGTGLKDGADQFDFDRMQRSLSLTLDTSTSSSGSEPLDSPPTESELEATHGRGGVGIRGTSPGGRPLMRHFPPVSSIQNKSRRASRNNSDDDDTYPTPTGSRTKTKSKTSGRSEMDIPDYMTTHSDIEPATMSKKLKVGVEQLFNARGRRRSAILKKLKDQAGSRLSRLFSSDGDDSWGSSRSTSRMSGGFMTWSREQSKSTTGVEEASSEMKGTSESTSVSVSVPESSQARRPSMSIDLSTVPTFRTEMLSKVMQPLERVPTPSPHRPRDANRQYIDSSPEQYYTPTAGSPVNLSTVFEPPSFQSINGLFGPGPVIRENNSGGVDETLVEALAAAFPAPRKALDLERAPSDGSGIQGINSILDTVSILPPKTVLSPVPESSDAELELETELEDIQMGDEMDLDSRIFSPSIFRAPHLMAMGGTPPISPLELPGMLDSGSSLIGLPPRSVGMKAMSSYGMLRRLSGSISDSASGSASGSQSMSASVSGSGSGSRGGSRGSRSSTGSSRMKIDGANGSNPHSASLTHIVSQISLKDTEMDEVYPLDLGPGLKSSLLHRSSVDLEPTPRRPSITPSISATAPRSSLPNVHFASPPTPTRVKFSPIITSCPSPSPSPSPTPSPSPSPSLSFAASPRPGPSFGGFAGFGGFGSPRFAQSAFPPISTPPSLLANPKSLGDPYPNGLSEKASQNLAGAECPCGCQFHAHPHIKRRSSTKRISERKTSVIATPTATEVNTKVDVAADAEMNSTPVDDASGHSNVKSTRELATTVNPYFA